MTAIVWPSTLKRRTVLFHPNIVSASGGASFSGAEQVTFSSAGRWRARLSLLIVTRPGDMRSLAARAMLAHLKGRSNSIYVPVSDTGNSPAGIAGLPIYDAVTHSDGAPFSDGAGYGQTWTPATVDGAVTAGALAMDVILGVTDQVIEAGQYFGLGPSELYLIKSVIDNGGGDYTLNFWPPLRTSHADGETVNFDDPTCEMRLMSDDSAELELQPYYQGTQQLEFVEAR